MGTPELRRHQNSPKLVPSPTTMSEQGRKRKGSPPSLEPQPRMVSCLLWLCLLVFRVRVCEMRTETTLNLYNNLISRTTKGNTIGFDNVCQDVQEGDVSGTEQHIGGRTA
jgi:hypothetical protein